MAYDELLAQKIRGIIGSDAGIDEEKMFGGLAVLLDGNMAVGVSGEELMVRVGAEDFEDALTEEGVRPFEMSDKGAKGRVLVGRDGVGEDEALECWVTVGMDFAGSLPAK